MRNLKSYYILFLLLQLSYYSYSQVGIGTKTPSLKSVLDLSSKDKGFLLPRMGSSERISILPNFNTDKGLQVYDTTTNSIWYWNGALWVNSGAAVTSNIYTSDGIVGINRNIGINNFINFDTATLYIDGINNRIGIGTTAPKVGMDIVKNNTELLNISRKVWKGSGLNVGIGFYYGGDNTELNNPIARISAKDAWPFNYGGDLVFSAALHSTLNDIMVIKGGNSFVGIGVASPSEKLDIFGNLKFSNALMPAGNAGTVGQILRSSGPGVAPTWGSLDANNTPNIYTNNGTIGAGRFINVTDFVNIDTNTLYVNGLTNRIGIGTNIPAHILHVVGTAGLSTGTAWTNTSDMRLKENVREYKRGLIEILQINPIYYSYTENSGLKNDEKYGLNIGVSAQELKKIIPEAISSNPIKLKDGTYLEDALQLIKADAMWFALINAVKEQQKQIEFLKKEIEIIKINNVNK
jgi:hypothetical protein